MFLLTVLLVIAAAVGGVFVGYKYNTKVGEIIAALVSIFKKK